MAGLAVDVPHLASRTHRAPREADEVGRPRWQWILLGSAGLWAWLAWRKIQKRLTPVDPDLALRYGLGLTRSPRRVLAVTAHQDDLELFVGGTLRLLALAGSSLTIVVATGGDQQYLAERTLEQIREQEELDAGNIIGYDTVKFLSFTDLELSRNPYFERSLERVWNDAHPDLVITFDPTAPYISAVHPDHLAVGRIVLNIVRSLKSAAPAVVFYGSRDPNILVDISQVIEDKTQAIACHRSQLYGFKRLYNVAMRLQTQVAGRSISVRYAEPLRYLSLPPLQRDAYLENWPTPGSHGQASRRQEEVSQHTKITDLPGSTKR